MEPPVEEAVAGKQKAESAEEKDSDSEDESYEDERAQSLPPGTFRFRFPVGAEPMQINFRDLVTQREAAKEEAEYKETADGARDGPDHPAESDFRYPVQNRFTGLIERIQNNPDFLEGYDLSDSFIAADSEEEEDSDDETVWGGFFINQGPILKKPRSDASPVKEKERGKKRASKDKGSDSSSEEDGGTQRRKRGGWKIPPELQAEIDALKKRAAKEPPKESGKVAAWLREPLAKIGKHAQELHPKGFMPLSVLSALSDFLDFSIASLKKHCAPGGDDGKSSPRELKRDSKAESEVKQPTPPPVEKEKASQKEELHKSDSKSAKKAKTDKPTTASSTSISASTAPPMQASAVPPPAAAAASTTISPAASSSSAPPSAKDETRKRTRISKNSIGDVAREAVAALDALLSEASTAQPSAWHWTPEADQCVFTIINVAKKKIAGINRSITLENKAQTDPALHKPTKSTKVELQVTYNALVEEFARFGFKISAETLKERFKKVDKAQKDERAAKRKPPAETSSAATLPAAATSINADD